MSADAVAGFDRLPLLPDEPAEQRQSGERLFQAAPLLAFVILVVLGGARIGSWAVPQNSAEPREPSSTTVPLPPVRTVQPLPPAQPAVSARSDGEVSRSEPHRVSILKSARVRHPARKSLPSRSLDLAGRSIEIGAFGSADQARYGWRAALGDYPGFATLPVKVAERRNSRGRTFYRVRIDTTSQAHSEVLCQRLQKIDLSCTVAGLPRKVKNGR